MANIRNTTEYKEAMLNDIFVSGLEQSINEMKPRTHRYKNAKGKAKITLDLVDYERTINLLRTITMQYGKLKEEKAKKELDEMLGGDQPLIPNGSKQTETPSGIIVKEKDLPNQNEEQEDDQ